MLEGLEADLHVHTCLSPCADLKMSAVAIVRQALAIGVDVLGICDHNSAENVPAAVAAASGRDVHVLPGMELTSCEEVHVLALFDDLESVTALQGVVYENLPGENDEETFGMQVVVNADDEVLSFNRRLLIGATTLTLQEIVQIIHSLGGLVIAAHIDRESFSLIGQLGFVPDDLDLDALEISSALEYDEAMQRYEPRLPLIQSSDAHKVEDIGRCRTRFLIEEPSVDEIRRALMNQGGRRILRE